MSLNTYLFFDGNCAAAFDFYKSVFGGEFEVCSTFGEAPPDMNFPEDESAKIMPMADTFWGSYFGMGKDKFGIPWMVSTDFERE